MNFFRSPCPKNISIHIKTRGCGRFGSVFVGLFLGLDDVFLVPNPFVAEPVVHLRNSYFASFGQFFFSFFGCYK